MEYEILPGVKVIIDPEKYSVTQAFQIAPQTEADVAIMLDLTIVDVIEKSESKVQGILQLRST